MLKLEFAHGRSGFQLLVENLPKGCDRGGGFFGRFLLWMFWSQYAKEISAEKICRKIRQPKKRKICRRTTPPKSASQAQKSAAKPTNKQTSKCTPGFVALRRLTFGGVFRAWILGHSLAAFWAWSRLCLGSHAEIHLQSLSSAGGRDKVCCTPFQATLLVKSMRLRKRPRNNKKNPPRDSANSGNPTILYIIFIS